jgi:hypothetical protein
MRVGGTTEYYAGVDAFLSRCITLGEGFQLLDRAAHGVDNEVNASAARRAILARVSETAVADDVRRQNRHELPGFAHCAPPAAGTLPQIPA